MTDSLFLNKRITDKDMFYKDVLKREKIESTNMEIGIAIPHSHATCIKKSSVAIVRLVKPIRWGSSEELVEFVFLLLASPTDPGITHLELISKIAELLIEDSFIQFLKTNDDPKSLINKIIDMVEE